MDIDLLHTFLEVRRLGNFHSAAENLHVTQAAVSQRIKHLETILTTPLFVREKNNIYPTAAGEQLVSTAESILEAWNQARRDIGRLPSTSAQLSLAAEPGAWELIGKSSLGMLTREWPELSLRADQLGEDVIAKRIRRQTLDIGLVFNRISHENVNCVAVFEFEIALYSSSATRIDQVAAQPNIYVEWGPEVNSLHEGIRFQQAPCLQTRDHMVARDYLETHPGVAFLPVGSNPRASKLKLVSKSPRLRRQVFALWHNESTQREFFAAIAGSLAMPSTPLAKI
jgi:DNA-binding transcriptional LysR family regulator